MHASSGKIWLPPNVLKAFTSSDDRTGQPYLNAEVALRGVTHPVLPPPADVISNLLPAIPAESFTHYPPNYLVARNWTRLFVQDRGAVICMGPSEQVGVVVTLEDAS